MVDFAAMVLAEKRAVEAAISLVILSIRDDADDTFCGETRGVFSCLEGVVLAAEDVVATGSYGGVWYAKWDWEKESTVSLLLRGMLE